MTADKEPKKTRIRRPVGAKLAAIDARIGKHQQAIVNLEGERRKLVADQRAKAEAILKGLPPETKPVPA
jgi:hypothetical protein